MKEFQFEGHRLAYEDVGSGTPVVLVHGTPSSSYEFREVINELSKNHRCIALDHLGFGASEKPKDGDYTLAGHTRRLRAFIDSLGIIKYHLVVHDFGGPIAIPILLEDPSRVLTLTLMNTWAWPLASVEPQLAKQKWLMTSPLMKFSYLYLNFSAAVMVKMAWGKHKPLTKEHHGKYKAAFRNASERMGTWGFVNALFDLSDPVWNSWTYLKDLKIRVMILWGTADQFISEKNLEKWKTVFPKAPVHPLAGVGHFVCDEAPELVIPLLSRHFDTSL